MENVNRFRLEKHTSCNRIHFQIKEHKYLIIQNIKKSRRLHKSEARRFGMSYYKKIVI